MLKKNTRSTNYYHLTRKNDMKVMNVLEHLFLFFVKNAVIYNQSN